VIDLEKPGKSSKIGKGSFSNDYHQIFGFLAHSPKIYILFEVQKFSKLSDLNVGLH